MVQRCPCKFWISSENFTSIAVSKVKYGNLKWTRERMQSPTLQAISVRGIPSSTIRLNFPCLSLWSNDQNCKPCVARDLLWLLYNYKAQMPRSSFIWLLKYIKVCFLPAGGRLTILILKINYQAFEIFADLSVPCYFLHAYLILVR